MAKKQTNVIDMLNELTDDEVTTAFLIMKVYDSMNYYSSEHPNYLDNLAGEMY